MNKALASTAVLLVLTTGSAHAVTTSFWTVTTQEGFAAGDLSKVSVNSGGTVLLAPPMEQLADTEELYIWSTVRDAAGNLFVGTGNNGKLFKMSADGELSLLADLEEPDILCLELSADGKRLFAGTSGSGIVYEIEASGSATPFHDTQQRYVWDLAFDDDGRLLAATGDDGHIYRINKQGQATLLFDSPETHIMHLQIGDDGSLYAGGEGRGLVYRLSPEGDPFVLHELKEPEVCCLTPGPDGEFYAAGISIPGSSPRGSPMSMGVSPAPPPPTKAAQAMGESVQEKDNPPAPPPGVTLQMAPPARPGAPGGGSSNIYRIDPDGVVNPVWSSSSDVVHALHLHEDGSLIAGTGKRGRLYHINPEDESWGVMAEVSASQLTTVIDLGDTGMLLGAANMGALFRVGPGHAEAGTLESTPFDASTWSAWGRLSWRAKTPGGTSIRFQTRSGNSSRPDSSWSPWAELDDGDDGSGQAVSPNARFAQWRAQLSSSKRAQTPTLQRVSLAYLQQNLKPNVHYVAVVQRPGSRDNGRPPDASKPGGGAPEPGPKPGLPVPADNPVKGPWMVKWQASDGNADRLQYDLYFRFLDGDEESWTLLEEDLSKESYRWDTTSFPDGFYELKVVASDQCSNPPETALSAHNTSEPVLVDNTPPEIRVKLKHGADGTVHVNGVAEDATGPITDGYYRVDGGDWVPLSPDDGIFDSAKESFSFELALSQGGHAVVLRVTDIAGNVGSQRLLR